MMKSWKALGVACAVAACGWVSNAVAQAYPSRTITLIVPFGAGGTIAANFVAKAQPDGYTIFIHHNGMATATGLYRKLPYNPLTDFEYVGQVADVPMTLLAKKDLPPDNLRDLITYVRANKEKINLANAGLGAVSHLCGMLFMQAVGVELTTIPFSGTAPAMTALLGGQVDMLCDQTTQTIPQIKAQKVKFYGVTTKQRITALPDAPTLDEQGLKDFEVIVWHGIYAPKGTPAEAIGKVNNALRIALKDPATVAKLKELGAEIVPESKQTSEGLRAWLQSEIDKWQPVIRAAGVYAD
jgi:tripartite-type tricarboxylate transporter receptor subunit TctC